jgi:hypothetical protein
VRVESCPANSAQQEGETAKSSRNRFNQIVRVVRRVFQPKRPEGGKETNSQKKKWEKHKYKNKLEMNSGCFVSWNASITRRCNNNNKVVEIKFLNKKTARPNRNEKGSAGCWRLSGGDGSKNERPAYVQQHLLAAQCYTSNVMLRVCYKGPKIKREGERERKYEEKEEARCRLSSSSSSSSSRRHHHKDERASLLKLKCSFSFRWAKGNFHFSFCASAKK